MVKSFAATALAWVSLVILLVCGCGNEKIKNEVTYEAPYTEAEMVSRARQVVSQIGHDPDCFTMIYELNVVYRGDAIDPLKLTVPSVLLTPEPARCPDEYTLRVFEVDGGQATWEFGTSRRTDYQEKALEAMKVLAKQKWPALIAPDDFSFEIVELPSELFVEIIPKYLQAEGTRGRVLDGTHFVRLDKSSLTQIIHAPRAATPDLQ